jgi:hypothetical protein
MGEVVSILYINESKLITSLVKFRQILIAEKARFNKTGQFLRPRIWLYDWRNKKTTRRYKYVRNYVFVFCLFGQDAIY